MPKKIKKRFKREKHGMMCGDDLPQGARIVSLEELLPKEIDIECPYGKERKATLQGFILDADSEEAGYECSCVRGDIRRDCVKTEKVSLLLEKENIVEIHDCPPE